MTKSDMEHKKLRTKNEAKPLGKSLPQKSSVAVRNLNHFVVELTEISSFSENIDVI